MTDLLTQPTVGVWDVVKAVGGVLGFIAVTVVGFLIRKIDLVEERMEALRRARDLSDTTRDTALRGEIANHVAATQTFRERVLSDMLTREDMTTLSATIREDIRDLRAVIESLRGSGGGSIRSLRGAGDD